MPTLRVRGVVRLLARPVAWLLMVGLPVQAVPYVPAQRVANGTKVSGVAEGPHPQTPAPRSFGVGGGGSGYGARTRRERAWGVPFVVAVDALSRTIFPDTAAPGSVFTENTYDAAGRLTAVRDARGKTTTYEYDRAGRRTKVTVPLTTGVSAETVFTYDANGNQLTVRDPLLRTTTFEYDLLNRRTKTLFPDTPQTFTETTYDELGRRQTERDQAGRVTTFGYDALGRLTSVTDARGKVTSYEYDEVGNRVAQIDANGHRTAFEYDRLGRETKRSLPPVGTNPAAFETKTYDAAGNLESRTDFAGRVTSYSYDVMNRLLGRTAQCATPPCAGAADASFTYTPSGRRETVTDARGVTAYAYDDRDRLQSLTYPDGRSLAYAHDGNGNRTTLTAMLPAVGGGSPTVLTTTYTHDDANRLDLVTDTAGRVYDHGYDLNGNRSTLSQPNGTLTSYVYDPLNRLTTLSTTHPGLGTTIQSYALTLGPAGNRERIDEADGTSRIYTYDELYRLTGDTVQIGALNQYTKGFTYDDVGNRLTQTTTIGPAGSPGPNLVAGTLAYEYDQRDRLTSETLDANPPTAYGWDDDGNLTTKSGEATYTWDRENRLTRVTKLNGTVVEHAYDVDGVRVRTITTPSGGSASTTNFLVDTSGSLSHVVAETDGDGALVVHYVRGDDLLALMRPNGSGGWNSRFYHADHIGSVRRLTDEAGQITDGYTYSAFGELLAHTGSDPQPYAFTGEPYDPNVGLQYHRARWMDPGVGRFAGADSFPGILADPSSLHRYGYAGQGPVNATDPTGLLSLPEISVTTLVNLTLRAISTIVARAAYGALAGGLIGAVDAHLAGRNAADGFHDGAIWGATFGALSVVKPLQPFLGAFGVGASGFGAYQAIQSDNVPLALYRSILGLVSAGVAIRPLVSGAAPPPTTRVWEARNLASAKRTAHILWGDATGGGHAYPGRPGHTPFPRGWSPAKIMHEISDIATDPTLTWQQQTGPIGSWFTRAGDPSRWFVVGVRDGVTIKVVIEPAGEGVITGVPIG